jgi:integrase
MKTAPTSTNPNLNQQTPSTPVQASAKRKRKGKRKPFYVAKVGRVSVPVYKRRIPVVQDGKRIAWKDGFQVLNCVNGKRQLDSRKTEQEAIEHADKLARNMSEQDVLSASMTREQALEFAGSVQALAGKVSVRAACSAVAEWLKDFASLNAIAAALASYRSEHREVVKKTVAWVADDLQKLKAKRGASKQYLADLKYRLGKFVEDCGTKNLCDLTTADLQDWLDSQDISTQTYKGHRTILFTLFHHGARRGYCLDNPVVGVEQVKVRRGDITVYSPTEIARLLAAAKPDFLPSLAIGAFAGLRSAEIVRLRWEDVDLPARHIIVAASKAKTASRRIVPISDNLAAWLADYTKVKGKVWPWPADRFYKTQQETAAATAIKADPEKGVEALAPVPWRANALRHSYCSYRFAETTDAGKVAGEMGNSAAMIFKHYRELVKPAEAKAWFSIKPEAPSNLISLGQAQQKSA